MSIPYSYTDIANRLAFARSWASEVTEGNRCAMVLGAALRLKPDNSSLSMHGQSFVKTNVREQPFTKKFFVKATDLSLAVLKKWGPPEIRIPGSSAAQRIEILKGFLYLEDCWKTPTEKFNSLLFDVETKSGDHVDLWNGSTLAIYPNRIDSLSLIQRSRNVWLWTFML